MTRGIVCALASAVLFGLSAPAAKLLTGAVDPWLLAGLLYLGSGLGLTALRPVLPRTGTPLRPGDRPYLVGALIAGGLIGPVLLMAGLQRSSAAGASLALNLESVFTLALAWLVFREGIDRRIMVGAGAILTGAVLLSWPADGRAGWDVGLLLVAAACAAWAVDNNLTRKVAGGDAATIAQLKGLIAGGVNTALALFAGADLPPLSTMAAAGLVGLAGYGMSLVLFVLALRHLGAARTGAYFACAPFVGAIVAVLFLGEPASPLLLAAGALMGLGLWLHLTEHHDHDHVHEAVEHDHPHDHDDDHHHHDHHHHDHDDAANAGPHAHRHAHARIIHRHPHFPDMDHRHRH